MREKLKYLLGSSSTRPIFVIGTGRSGSHWIGYSLGDHPEIRTTVEVQPMFGLSTRMAQNPELEERLIGKLVRAYKWQLFKFAPRLYLDKTHPNIWIAERLKRSFPRSLFVGIERNPYATVSSMMKHKGVSAWHDRWREFPVPNRFLGITQESAPGYDDIPRAAQCALRWVAHHERMSQLRDVLPEDLMVVSYEELAVDTESVIARLQNFLGLRSPIPVPEVKTESLYKWKNNLTREEIEQISTVVGFGPDETG